MSAVGETFRKLGLLGVLVAVSVGGFMLLTHPSVLVLPGPARSSAPLGVTARDRDAAPPSVLRPGSLAGPVSARVVRVLDGDTLEVVAHIWVDQTVTTKVRLAGIDTPEKRGKCAAERARAETARAMTAAAAPPDSTIRLRDIILGKYAGRIVARVELADGRDLSAALIAAGLGRPYDGGKRTGWCDGNR